MLFPENYQQEFRIMVWIMVFLAEGSSDPQGQLTPTASQSHCLAIALFIDLLAGGLQNGARGCVNNLGQSQGQW